MVANYAEQFLAPLHEHLTDDGVNEVVINPDRSVWVERANSAHMERIEHVFDEQTVESIGRHLANETENKLGDNHPIVSGRVMLFGASVRVQIVTTPAVERGVSISIRRYVSRVIEIEACRFLGGRLVDLEKARAELRNTIGSLAQTGDVVELFRRAIDDRLNILISGGTSSGKTTFARSLLGMTDRRERVVTIEDALELHPPHENQVAMVAERAPGSERSPTKLLQSALRMRPDRLILGEVRGEEAADLLEAINTGHPGSISTIHADSPGLAKDRLTLMVMRSGIRLSTQDVRDYVARTIDLIVQVGRQNGQRGLLAVEVTS